MNTQVLLLAISCLLFSTSALAQLSAPLLSLGNNGSSYSRTLEVNPTMDTIIWSYGNATDEYFYGDHISGTQRLDNGNTLVCNGVDGVIFELDSEGNKLREYTNSYGGTTPRGTITEIFRAEKYASGYTPYF